MADAERRSADRGLSRLAGVGRLAGLGRAINVDAEVVINQAETVNIGSRPAVEPGYLLGDFPLTAPPVPALSRRQPSKLLAARYRVVPFTEREDELRQLAGWRDDPGLGIAVRLVHGPGGEGKSRLAAEFAVACAQSGWQVSEAVRRPQDDSAVSADAAARPDRKRVVIVDYAERWPPSDLIAMIAGPLLRDAAQLRVLLLARSEGTWWTSLRYGLGEAQINADRLELTPLADDLDTRFRIFIAARDRFADILDVDKQQERLRPRAAVFTNNAFSRALTIHMAALAAVQSAMDNENAPLEPLAVSEYLLDREREHWRRLFSDYEEFATRPAVMARAVYTAILTNHVPYDVGIAVLGRVGIATSQEAASQVLDDHAVCYPAVDGVLEPLYPDRLAEDFIALQTPGLPAEPPKDQWAARAVGRLLALDRDQPVPEWAGQALTVLVEVSRRWPHFAERQLRPLLLGRPWLAVAAGGQVLSRLAGIREIDLEVLSAVESSLPSGARVDLDAGIAEITRRVATERLPRTTSEETRGDIYRNLGWRQANAGLFSEATDASAQAARIFARLAPSAHTQSKLAQTLHDLGQTEAELGDIAGALTSTEDAVAIYRRLVTAGSVNLEPRLAAALTDLGRHLWARGATDEALAATNESVRIYRRLLSEHAGGPGSPADKAVKRWAQLARSLRSLGLMLSGTDAAAALDASREAVEILTPLAAADPGGYELDLAIALDCLGTELARQGMGEAALESTERAVAIGRRLLLVSPAAMQPRLAAWLVHLGTQLLAVGRTEEGLQALTEAADAQRKLAQASPVAHPHGLALALASLAGSLVRAGRAVDAVPVAAEALDLCRALARDRPDLAAPNLASALWLLADVRVAAETQLPEALADAREATAIYQALAAETPDYRDDLVETMSLTADVLAWLGRADEAAALRDTDPRDLPAGPWLEALRADTVESVERVVREVAGQDERAAEVTAAVRQADVYALHGRGAPDADPASAPEYVILRREDGSELPVLPIFTNPAAIRVALTRVADSYLLAVRRSAGAELLAQIRPGAVPVLNLWSDFRYVMLPPVADAEEEFPADDSLGLERVEAVLRQAAGNLDQAQAIRAAVSEVEIYALGHMAGDTSVLDRGTDSDLLHFAVDIEDREVILLPVFTNAGVMREALLRNPEWQQLSVLSVNGGALLANVDDEVAVVVDPWSELEFRIPSRLDDGTAGKPGRDDSAAR